MDQITLDRIKEAHPSIRKQLQQQYIEANNLLGKGARLRFAYVYRSNSLSKSRIIDQLASSNVPFPSLS